MASRDTGIDISMDRYKWAKLELSLADSIEKWATTICEDTDLGWWYDDVCFDMAQAAIGILKASTSGQIKYKEESK